MRHQKHRHQLGVKKEHRQAIMASLASALFRHDKIQTTLGYAKALRPFAEKMITLAKKAAATDDTAKKLHYRRQALAKIRDVSAVHFLFAEKVSKFLKREGGYTRIYKLVKRVGDAADMAIIELIEADDQGYKAQPKKATKAESPKADEAPVVEEATEEKKPAKKTATKKATKKAATKKVAKKKASAEETKE
ncbi:MAG: 50S ribosomal protein L17 [Opitutales bacterium]|nr:50S ribosomal protein L17 [Opitutales bacterium]